MNGVVAESSERDTVLVRRVVSRLSERHLTIATAESLTAGLVSAGIADVPGASAVLRGGVVTYATEAKASVLGVPHDLLAERGAVDADVAVAMARGALRLFAADLAVATTGVAGPSEQDGQPVGRCFVAVALRAASSQECGTPSERCHVQQFDFIGDRQAVRLRARDAAWRMVLDAAGTLGVEG